MMVRCISSPVATLIAILSFVSCGGGGTSNVPTSPSGGTPPAPSGPAVTIDIRSTSTAQSFVPNPASVNQGGTVAWRNGDSQTHRIVANDGSFDSGDIAAGATSRNVPLSRGTNYHCALHTTMVGAIGVAAEPPPPCTGPYC